LSRSPYAGLEREIRKQRKKKKERPEIQKWREHYRKVGPVEFTKNELASPMGTPPHPEFGRPTHVILSSEQIDFLDDLFSGQKLSIVSASRGAGKTFCLAIYICWKITCFDFFQVTAMGGSAKQSEIIENYIDYWRVKNSKLRYCLPKSVSGHINPRIESRWGSIVWFISCAETSSRGQHVRLVAIDEVVTAESKGIDGQKAVRAVWWQITGKEDAQLIMTSTAHRISGTFYDYYNGPIGKDFKKYRWAIAKHISGIDDPYKIYEDINPANWKPKVWWVTEEDIRLLRKAKSNAEWLCEALGGFSQAGGLIFKRENLNDAICDLCDVCKPYSESCKLIEKYDLGKNASKVTERVAGIDWGDRSPNAITIIGRKGEKVFVLFNEEIMSALIEEKLQWAKGYLDSYGVGVVYPDPEERAMNQALENVGDWAIIRIWEVLGQKAKSELMLNIKRFSEKHEIIIPKAFDTLIRSLKQMSMDKRGKVIKRHDHGYDSLSYALKEFDSYESLTDFWKVKNREIKDLW